MFLISIILPVPSFVTISAVTEKLLVSDHFFAVVVIYDMFWLFEIDSEAWTGNDIEKSNKNAIINLLNFLI